MTFIAVCWQCGSVVHYGDVRELDGLGWEKGRAGGWVCPYCEEHPWLEVAKSLGRVARAVFNVGRAAILESMPRLTLGAVELAVLAVLAGAVSLLVYAVVR